MGVQRERAPLQRHALAVRLPPARLLSGRSPTTCPVCGGDAPVDTVTRERLPAMQNYVHRDRSSALEAAQGSLVLAVCPDCGYAWNRVFDEAKLVYDENYDNAVPSRVMRAYYEEIAAHLRDSYALEAGDVVVDVGCGDGAFLRALAAVTPGLRGVGVDPALPADSREGDLTWVKDIFRPEHVTERPALVLSRHVVEHIPSPTGFLRVIAEAVAPHGECPVFVEVPDLEWILAERAFWDFCYEHCNYFTAAGMSAAFGAAGLRVRAARNAFGGQYLWVEGSTEGGALELRPAGTAERAAAYADEERRRIESAAQRVAVLREGGAAVAAWGMATKGVLFSLLVDPRARLIDHCVDLNANKQGGYVPLTGHRIEPPEVLAAVHGPLTIFVMNENYLEEIRDACRALRVDASFANAGGEPL